MSEREPSPEEMAEVMRQLGEAIQPPKKERYEKHSEQDFRINCFQALRDVYHQVNQIQDLLGVAEWAKSEGYRVEYMWDNVNQNYTVRFEHKKMGFKLPSEDKREEDRYIR